MADTQEVIYRAANLEQANLLKNLLQEQGIEAQVTNAVLQQATGDLPYWGIEPRLVVDVNDAVDARRIAIDFEQVVAQRLRSQRSGGDSFLFRAGKLCMAAYVWAFMYVVVNSLMHAMGLRGVVRTVVSACFVASAIYLYWSRGKRDRSSQTPGATAARLETNNDSETPASPWPTCPNCSRPRHTSCPVCETAGTEFPRAFMHESGDKGGGTAHERLLVLCTICDEPFEPEFNLRCEWCGHRFADGKELPTPKWTESDLSPRAWIVLVGIVAVVIGAIGLFAYIAPRP